MKTTEWIKWENLTHEQAMRASLIEIPSEVLVRFDTGIEISYFDDFKKEYGTITHLGLPKR